MSLALGKMTKLAARDWTLLPWPDSDVIYHGVNPEHLYGSQLHCLGFTQV